MQQSGVEVDIVEREAQDLAAPCAGVDERTQHRLVAPAHERLVALAYREQAAQLGLTQDGRWLLGQAGRLHPGHGARPDLTLVDAQLKNDWHVSVAVLLSSYVRSLSTNGRGVA